MGQNIVWIVLCALVFVVGLVIFIQGIKKTGEHNDTSLMYKDGLPILPRAKRQRLIDKPVDEPLAQATDETIDEINLDNDFVGGDFAGGGYNRNMSSQDADVNQDSDVNQGASQANQRANTQTNAQTRTDESDVKQSDPLGNLAAMASRYNQRSAEPSQTHTSRHNPNTNPNAHQQAQAVKPSFWTHHQMPDPTLEEAAALDKYFDYQKNDLRDDQALFGFQQTITVVLRLNNKFMSIDGRTIVQLAQQYALKFGVLNAFHRYENPQGTGVLWFSMLGVDGNHVVPFDLLTLPDSSYRGLSLFMTLPHPQALRGFDSMIQVATAMAQELDAYLSDEMDNVLGTEQIQTLRAMISNYDGA